MCCFLPVIDNLHIHYNSLDYTVTVSINVEINCIFEVQFCIDFEIFLLFSLSLIFLLYLM